jgi:hypothetical protein
LDKELKTLVGNEALRMGEPPSLRFVFETSERIKINLLEEKAAMGFLKREEKPPEKVKVAKASLPSHVADTNATCFKCGKAGHFVATQDRVFPHYVPNSSIKHSKSDSKDRSQEIL